MKITFAEIHPTVLHRPLDRNTFAQEAKLSTSQNGSAVSGKLYCISYFII